ncbi:MULTISPECIES: hypothetical protein [unclassified Bacillus (in: firmicutes)]|nr:MULTISPECIES: hypothetical protein [unclassified Bacillus (in: firmicutes)]
MTNKEQRDKEEKENIIKMIRDLKARGVYGSVGTIIKHHGYIVLAELVK